jgi:hypothetical protein
MESSASYSEDELAEGFIEGRRRALIFPQVTDYDPQSISLAEQIKQLNALCSSIAQALLTMNKKLDSCDERLTQLTAATQRDLAGEIVQELAKAQANVPAALAELLVLAEAGSKPADLAEMVAIMRKIKPLIKTMGKRLETIESRDLRMENLYLREKIPFHFQPHHSSGLGAAIGQPLRPPQGKK